MAKNPRAHPFQSILSLTYNYMYLQSSQPTKLRELFTIQPTRSTRSSSCLTLSRPPVTSHLMFSNQAISITAPMHVFGMTYPLNYAPFLRLHRRHCQSQGPSIKYVTLEGRGSEKV